MRLVRFTHAHDGRPVFINPEHVAYVMLSGETEGGAPFVMFGNGRGVTVRESMLAVTTELQGRHRDA